MSTRNDRDLDDLLSDDAGRIGASYRKLSKIEPPRRLDRNVLTEASRAVHGRPRASRWLLGVGTAAGVLLAGGIAWRVNYDMLQQRESAPMAAPAAEAIPSDVIRVEPHDRSGSATARSDTLAPSVSQPSAAAAEPDDAAVSESKTRDARKPAEAKQKVDNAFVADPAVKKSAPESGQVTTHIQPERREQAPPLSRPALVPPVVAAPMLAPIPEGSTLTTGMRDNVEAADSPTPESMPEAERVDRSVAAGADAPLQADARRERSSTSSDAAVNAGIDRIRALLRAGERDAARGALREFRRTYPDAFLPADLRALDG